MKNTSKFLLAVVILSGTLFSNAQTKKDKDLKAIKAMSGCYEVTFNFAETFEYSEDSTYLPSKPSVDKALEWVQIVEDEADKISLQHLLIVGKPGSEYIVKHWRQDWEYENTDFYVFDHDNTWNYVNLPDQEVKGQWSQKVFQVDDSPRYEGSATWVHVDGKSFWENKTSAPLPRREYTKRSDYNVTIRRNRQELTAYGWLHEQDNDKVMRKVGQDDVLLAKEKGYNTYKKVADNKCKAAQDWWVENQEKWAAIRSGWETIFNRNQGLKLHSKVNNKLLYKYLFDEEFDASTDNVNQLLNSFVAD